MRFLRFLRFIRYWFQFSTMPTQTAISTLPMLVIMAALATACLGLSGCTFPLIYRMNVQQGNIICPHMAPTVKKGMTKGQVLSIMGTPLLHHCYTETRWDYYYTFRPGRGGPTVKQHVVIYFKGDRVTDVADMTEN